MSRSKSRGPSPALIVAAIALTFAMVGTSVAQDPVAKLTNKKVKRVAKKQIRKAAPNLSVARAVGADLATNATRVNNLSVQEFAAKPAPGTALAAVATLGTLSLQAGCQADGDPLLSIAPAPGAASQADRTAITLSGENSTFGNGNSTLPASGLVVLNGDDDLASGSIEAVTSAGAVTTIQFAARSAGNFNPPENVCLVWGTAIAR